MAMPIDEPPLDERIGARVPHRPPILRVHRIVADGATGARLLGREPVGAGSLPWAVGAIEGLAQSAAVLLGHGLGDAPARSGRLGMLVAVKGYRVLREPPPGAEIDYEVRLLRRIGATARVAGTAACAGEPLASGELTLWIRPDPV